MISIPFHVSRSLLFSTPIESLYDMVSDFSTWRTWSPWLCQEPECPVEIQGNPGSIGHTQAWTGERIGIGSMKLAQVVKNKELHFETDFIKP